MLDAMISFIKREIVFVIASAAALITAFFNPPSMEWIEAIDFRTIAILFSLMGISEGLKASGLFSTAASQLAVVSGSMRQLSYLLIAIVFISSMFFTNDVALLVFVPFTMMLLDNSGADERYIATTVVIETISANLGSMTTPVGNPQNLYICSFFGVDAGDFFSAILPYSVLSAILIAILSRLLLSHDKPLLHKNGEPMEIDKPRSMMYIVFLVIAMLSVFRIISWKTLLISECIAILAVDRKVFRRIDYILLLTFIAFFIFSENIRSIEKISSLISGPMATHPVAVSALVSQVISNVPAAILLSPFAESFEGILIGTDIGGLGTPIASLASLISLKFYFSRENGNKAMYMAVFLSLNLLLLAVLAAFRVLCS